MYIQTTLLPTREKVLLPTKGGSLIPSRYRKRALHSIRDTVRTLERTGGSLLSSKLERLSLKPVKKKIVGTLR